MAAEAEFHNKYPKTRAELPPAFREIYDQHYKDNRFARTRASRASSRMESWMHKKVAEPARSGEWDTLEIGAGTLNQLDYEPVSGPYDIVEPYDSLYADSGHLGRLRNIYRDIGEIDPGVNYGRITSVAVLEHILDLPAVLARSALLLADEGIFQAAIPSEGTWLWKLGTRYAGREFSKKYGLDYQVLMKYEHVNDADEIEEALRFFFRKIKCRVLGLSRSCSFYRFYECSCPDRKRALNFLSGKNTLSGYNEDQL